MQMRTGIRQLFNLVPGVVPVIHLQNQMKQKTGLKTVWPSHPFRCKTPAVQMQTFSASLSLGVQRQALHERTYRVQNGSAIWA